MRTIFFGASPSIVKNAYSDVVRSDDVEYLEYPCGKPTKSVFLTHKFLSLCPFAAKKIFNEFLGYDFLKTLKKTEKALFVFVCQYGGYYESWFSDFIKYLKKRFVNAGMVFYYNDLIETCNKGALPFIKKNFDLTLTFDKTEAEEYGITYYGEICSENKIPDGVFAEPSDLYAVISDRGRYDKIIEAFRYFSDKGVKCVFYLFDILKENRGKFNEFSALCEVRGEKTLKYKNSILVYDTYSPYDKTLAHINKCKCMLEIVINGQSAGSLRLPESVIYKKKLITNCLSVKDKPFYNENNICVFDKITDVDEKFIYGTYADAEYNFSPLKMIEFAKNKLFGEEE